MTTFTLTLQTLELAGEYRRQDEWLPLGPDTKLEARSPAEALSLVTGVPILPGNTYRIRICGPEHPTVFSIPAVTPTLPAGLQ